MSTTNWLACWTCCIKWISTYTLCASSSISTTRTIIHATIALARLIVLSSLTNWSACIFCLR